MTCLVGTLLNIYIYTFLTKTLSTPTIFYDTNSSFCRKHVTNSCIMDMRTLPVTVCMLDSLRAGLGHA